MACEEVGTTEQLRDERLNWEIFYSLGEAKVGIENWPIHYNTKCLHSTLGYRPPAPVTIAPNPTSLDSRLPMQQSLISAGTKYRTGQVRQTRVADRRVFEDRDDGLHLRVTTRTPRRGPKLSPYERFD